MHDVSTFGFIDIHSTERILLRSKFNGCEQKAGAGRYVRRMKKIDENSARIVRIAQHADKAAFAELFSFYAPRIKGFFMRGGMAAGQAEELAQETMLTVWRKAALFDPAKAAASTWIFTVARNLRIDLIRRERYPAQHLLEEHDPEYEPTPSEGLLKAESEERIRTAIKALSPEQIRVIHLHYFDDKPHSEIAETLDLPLGTVKSRLRLAVQRLRSLIGED
ncbi:RNA polymerase sigma factor, sigma-70 family [Phyllobacterium sp. YR531]|nr:RNA polymerase sigma factor, sigma-70 family [Phyllobacterium sp. YR531]